MVLEYLSLFFSPDILFFLVLGVIYFMIFGIIPALGAPAGLAILLPLIFQLNEVQAFALCLGGATGVYLSGAITSIILNVPGTSEHVSLCFDGHPLARKGKTGTALGAAAMTTLIAGVASPLILLLLIPYLREVVLALGPAEILMVIIWGLITSSTLIEGKALKGVASLFFGLLLSTIGFSYASSYPRFIFGGQLILWEGIPLVPLFIGILALPVMFEFLIKGEKTIALGKVQNPFRGLMEGIKETFRSLKVLIEGTLIGYFIGSIPGIGGATANLVAYARASRSSKRPEKFGQGNIDGVVAPQASIAAVWGGALLPVLAFGIPGSETMALILGIFIMKGITPGISLFKTNLPLVYYLVWLLIIGAIVSTLLTLTLTPVLVKLTTIRLTTIVPFVFLLILIGVYALRQSVFDIFLTLLLGLLGYEMVKSDFPRAPFVIAFVLGSYFENNLTLTLNIYGPSFLWTRPIATFMLIITVLTLLYPLLRRKKKA